MKKLFSILALALVAGIMLWAGDACATSEAWNVAFNKATTTFQFSRRMIFIIGGFGLVVLAFWAIFGKIKWPWFAALCVGLGIVAIAGLIIDYVTTDPGTGSGDATSSLSNYGSAGQAPVNGSGS